MNTDRTSLRHSRAGEDPVKEVVQLDSRLRGNDEVEPQQCDPSCRSGAAPDIRTPVRHPACEE